MVSFVDFYPRVALETVQGVKKTHENRKTT